jgi:hypothetical protein
VRGWEWEVGIQTYTSA